MPSDLITVPACEPCQRLFQPHEAYFRDFVAGSAYHHPVARGLWETTIRRSFERDDTARAALADRIVELERQLPDGSTVRIEGIEGDRDRLAEILKKSIRGLFFHQTGGVMDRGIRWRLEHLGMDSEPLPPETLDVLAAIPTSTVGGDVVVYKFEAAPGDARMTLSLVRYYATTTFVVSTMPEGGSAHYDALLDADDGRDES